MTSRTNATFLWGSLNWASMEDTLEAVSLTGNKSLMNDKPMMPFIQQMTDASMRQFMSMPNGDFFAFYPDYFGETFHRPPYWYVNDIEILDGRVKLNVEEYPMVRHPFFELFLAYQHFMQAWSRQFLTPFQFTFMPELYPGGKVGLPDHGLQMYIEEVTHNWDYSGGFVTQAQLSSPAVMRDKNGKVVNPNLPPNMPTALLEQF
jgi:hypothetical protein